MASTCPKCHAVVGDEIVCCADVKYTWKCKSCSKLSTGFVVPFGRCFMCGGELEVIEGYSQPDEAQVEIVREAMQYEIDMYQFYRLGKERVKNDEVKNVLEEMHLKEKDHIAELEDKYHVHLEEEMLEPPGDAETILSKWIFAGIDFLDATSDVLKLYDRAIEMERRTRDRFQQRAAELPPGKQREIYKELAAEEEEHVSFLEGEREHLAAS